MALSKSTWAKRVRLACIASIASAIAAVAIPATMTSPAEAKTPGKTYCFVGKCHRVKTIEETAALVGVEESITASHYDDCSKDRFNPCGLTSSGERFHPDRPDNTASPIYPDGTQLLVWSPENKRALVVRVNNAGPYWGNRTLDLSRAAAEKLGFEGEGVAKLKVRVIKAPEEAETKYVENRNYDPVAGDIGQYASLDDAQRGMAVVLAFKATTGSPFAPVTTANAFNGQAIGSDMLVAEAPQAMGRSVTLAYAADTKPIAFGGFSTQSRADRNTAQTREQQAANQTPWDEDRVIDEPVKVVASVTETSSITKQAAEPEPRKMAEAREAPEAKKSPNARLAAAAYEDDAKPRKTKKRVASDDDDTKSKKVASNRDDGDTKSKKKVARKSDDDDDAKGKKKVARKSDDDEDKSERRRSSRREVASYEERRSYRAERDYQYSSRYAQVERNYGSGGNSDGGRSAGQTTTDNFRPL
jgi:rare lipoprotein A (peptidoglycan hydrolase)